MTKSIGYFSLFGTETDARVGTEKWTTEETGFVRNEKQNPRACKLTVVLFDSHKSQPQFTLRQKKLIRS